MPTDSARNQAPERAAVDGSTDLFEWVPIPVADGRPMALFARDVIAADLP